MPTSRDPEPEGPGGSLGIVPIVETTAAVLSATDIVKERPVYAGLMIGPRTRCRGLRNGCT